MCGKWDPSSSSREQTWILCIGRWNLNHWTSGKLGNHFLSLFSAVSGPWGTSKGQRHLAQKRQGSRPNPGPLEDMAKELGPYYTLHGVWPPTWSPVSLLPAPQATQPVGGPRPGTAPQSQRIQVEKQVFTQGGGSATIIPDLDFSEAGSCLELPWAAKLTHSLVYLGKCLITLNNWLTNSPRTMPIHQTGTFCSLGEGVGGVSPCKSADTVQASIAGRAGLNLPWPRHVLPACTCSSFWAEEYWVPVSSAEVTSTPSDTI